MKRIISGVLCLLALLAFVGCDAPQNVEDNKVKAVIDVAGYGSIELELYPDIAPISVANFAALAQSGFYNGKIFHRVMSGFMIQGGSADGLGYTGSDHHIKGEFSANGVENDISHERGVISMARTDQSYDSATSQFFIMHRDTVDLDGKYAAFGRVTNGMEVVDAIAGVEVNETKPIVDVVIKSVTVTIESGVLPTPQYVD